MIRANILHQYANKDAVRPQQIEKDYMISWLLWGISKHDLLKDILIFKGGTCLKKVFIEDYRYSEDMDFTLDPEMERPVQNEVIYAAFNELFEEIEEAANIALSINEDSKGVHETSQSIRFYIEYMGPLGGKGSHLKVDITRGEKLEFEPIQGLVLHHYSDLQEEGEYKVKCYSLLEVLIEKMVALMGRTIPRDLYDFDYLTYHEGIDLQHIFYEFNRKAQHKGHNPQDFVEIVTAKQKSLEKSWNANLSHQIRELPQFKEVWRRTGKQFRRFKKIT